MDLTCPNCGAENYESARYCRKCGNQLGSSEFHEAPTRGLEHQRPDEAPPARAFDTFGSAPLGGEGPRYAPPSVTPSAAGLQPAGFTNAPLGVETGPVHSGPVKKGTNWFLVIGAIVLAAFLGGVVTLAIVAGAFWNRGAPPPPPPPAGAPSSPPVAGGTPSAPAVPPPGSLPAPAESDPLRQWYYQGATISVSQPNLLIMTTKDDVSKVADFYRKTFADRGVTPMQVADPDEGGVVMTGGSDGTTVVVSPPDEGEDGDETNIVVTLGGFPIQIPGFGPPPAPTPKASR